MTPFFRRRRGNDGNAPAAVPSAEPPRSASSPGGFATRRRARGNGPGGGRTPASRTPASRPPAAAPIVCHTCRLPIPPGERHVHTSRALSGMRRYHRQCFACAHCQAPIDPHGQSFCYGRVGGVAGDEHPFHRECFARHFGWMCVVCEKPLPMVTKVDDDRPGRMVPGSTTANGNSANSANSANSGVGSPGHAGNSSNTGNAKRTKVEFLKHPFFDRERMCPHHAGPIAERVSRHVRQNPNDDDDDDDDNRGGDHPRRSSRNTTTSEEVIGEIRRCAGCHRFEPLFADQSKHFIDVGDSNTGRCVCLACCRTVVLSTCDVIPLWEGVINFFEGPLGLITSEESLPFGDDNQNHDNNHYISPCKDASTNVGVTRRDMENIPVVVVGMEALNDNVKRHGSGHMGTSQMMTRGLCLSERCCEDRDSVGVTAILCLSGLPKDLTASILAHEATHAWIKLHPNFPPSDPLPLKVEEGLCQLVAHLFLADGLDPVARPDAPEGADDAAAPDGTKGDSNPSDERLRQYFRFCIETDEGVYGEGFRLAARAYARMGIQELLYHVAVHHDFPPM